MRIIILILVIAVVVTAVGILTTLAQDREDKTGTTATPGMSLAFDVVEAEFKALTPVLSMSVEEKAKAIIRERLIVCTMVMQRCEQIGTVVTRERPYDGFEHRKVTREWIQKYIDQVSKYPEWKNRNRLVIGILAKVSG